jgi:acetyl-CoA acetyltransferase
LYLKPGFNTVNIYSSLAIAGVGEADLFVDRVRSAKDLAVEAALKAMDDAGIRSHDIDGVITASPAADPHFVFSSLVGEALNINARLSTALQNAGASPMLGVMYAARAIASGEAHTLLVCESDSRGAKFKGDKIQAMRAARPWSDDFEDPFGLTVPAKYALLAQAWMHRYGAKPQDLAGVAVAAREHGRRQPNALKKEPLSIEAVLNSPMIASPLRALDCCPVSDWGGALIVTSLERARDMKSKPVRILGAGEGHSAYHLHETRDLPSLATHVGAMRAFKMAGLEPADVDVAQVFDAFSIAAILALEEIGLCEKGEGASYFSSGKTALGGVLPTNTTGGMMTWGNAHIIVLPEAVRQARGDAGINQVKNAKVSLAHGIGGPMSLSSTLLLGQ